MIQNIILYLILVGCIGGCIVVLSTAISAWLALEPEMRPCNPRVFWTAVVFATLGLFMFSLGVFTLDDMKKRERACPQYEQVHEPLYKQVSP